MHNFTTLFAEWLMAYGSVALFVLLAVGIAGLPIPDETLMTFAGFLIAKGKLSAVPTIIAAILGGACGISVSYALGITAGSYLVTKYGGKIGITHYKVEKIHRWFERIGKWTLFFGYFIPGVRHLTGYVAGTTRLSFHRFALFAYSGSIVWASTFLSLGYFFGEAWLDGLRAIDRDIWLGILVILFLIILIGVFHRHVYKRRWKK